MAAKEQAQQRAQLRHAGHTDAGTPRPRMPVKCQDKIATPERAAGPSGRFCKCGRYGQPGSVLLRSKPFTRPPVPLSLAAGFASRTG